MYKLKIFIQNINGDIMDNSFYNQNIDCDVKNCKFCDYSMGKCMLASIRVVNSKNDAFCGNYQKK